MLILIGTLLFTSILTPPLVASIRRGWGMIVLVSAMTALAGGCSLHLVFNRSIDFWQWCQCELVLFCFLAAVGICAVLLMRLRLDAVSASAIVTLLVLAWLTAPVWLSGPLEGCRLHYSVALHPLFVINGIVPQLGIWTEQQVAYSLTSVGQDVQYDLPGSIWMFVGVYVVFSLVGAALLVLKSKSDFQPAN